MSPEQIAALIEESHIAEPVYRSRVYGYFIEKGKSPTIISSEADVIRIVVQRLASGTEKALEVLEHIAQELRSRNIRTRSKTLFSSRTLTSLVRPYYAGMEINTSGVLCPTAYYPQILAVQDYLKARRRLEQCGMDLQA